MDSVPTQIQSELIIASLHPQRPRFPKQSHAQVPGVRARACLWQEGKLKSQQHFTVIYSLNLNPPQEAGDPESPVSQTGNGGLGQGEPSLSMAVPVSKLVLPQSLLPQSLPPGTSRDSLGIFQLRNKDIVLQDNL